MRQRNPGPYPRVLPTLDPPHEVLPGDVIDHSTPLAGFVLVNEQAESADRDADPSPAVDDPPGPVDQDEGDGQDPPKKKTSRGRRADDTTEATQ